jgi:hypothetical protein
MCWVKPELKYEHLAPVTRSGRAITSGDKVEWNERYNPNWTPMEVDDDQDDHMDFSEHDTAADSDHDEYIDPFISKILLGYVHDKYFSKKNHTKKLFQSPIGLWLKRSTIEQPDAAAPRGVKHVKLVRIVVPDHNGLRQAILQEFHDAPYSGHKEPTRTADLIKRNFWWPKWRKDVEDFCKTCDSCQKNKSRTTKSPGLLKPLPVPAGK